MVQNITSLQNVNFHDTWLTIGSFDGVHIGHQQLIRQLNTSAHQAQSRSVVLTFYPHPAVVIRGRNDAFYLTTNKEKIKLLEELGVDILITHPFSYEISQISARDFISYLLVHLGFQQLWIGHDFALGKGREGNEKYLRSLGEELNFQVHVMEPVTASGLKVSSSEIRKLLLEGKVSDANRLLGRPYQIVGEVIHGDGRGKSIGIPTANLDPGSEKLIPAAGIYACRAEILGKIWPAAVNIGTRPTFESTNKKSQVEAHLLDYSGDLYTQIITLEFISWLRNEERFQSVDELIKQIHLDIERTRAINSVTQKT